jgi:hypothetical protein
VAGAGAALAVAIVLAGACSSPAGPEAPTRDALVTLARQGDPALDDKRAGCIVDALTAKLGAGRAGAVLQTRPPATLPPADTDAVATAGITCSGASGIAVPAPPPVAGAWAPAHR